MSDTGTVLVVGGGVSGMTAALFTARAGLETTVVDHGESILNRNAHLENVPGFPAGVNARAFLDLTREQAENNGVTFRTGRAVHCEPAAGSAPADGEVPPADDTNGDGTGGSEDDATEDADRHRVRIETEDGETDLTARYVVAASWSDASYLDGTGVGLLERGSKTYIDADEDGATAVDGLYAAGRLAGKPHQTVVAAGHGAEVGLAVIEESEVPFYHDWVAPEGYFTDRGREVPPGCEEIDATERERREQASLASLQRAFDEPRDDEPTMHPSVADDGSE
jgi:thioredoxin reductase